MRSIIQPLLYRFGWYIWSALVFLSIYLVVPVHQPGQTLIQPNYVNKLTNLDNAQVKEVLFIDRTLQAGITTPHSQKSAEITGIHESLGAGICTFDANSDGWLDILIFRGTGSTHYFGKREWWQKSNNSVSLYINNRDGTFSDIAQRSGLISTSVSMGCAIGDLDADGDQDIFLANRGPNEVWENIGNANFSQRANFSQPTDNWSTSATIADLNGDGMPDIYVTNYLAFKPNRNTFEASAGFTEEKDPNFDPNLHSGVANQLLINIGNLAFKDKVQSLGASNPQGRGLASTVSDINADGKLDLLVANDSNSENKLYINTGNGFKDESTNSQLSILGRTLGAQIVNLTGETEDSLLISSGETKFSRVLTLDNDAKKPIFKDLSDTWRLNTLSGIHDASWSSAIADFNMDGWLDTLVVNGGTLPNGDAKQLSQGQPNYLLLNSKGDFFVKQSSGLGSQVASLESSRCAVSGDFNNDGLPDAIIANNNGLAQLLINNNDQSNWVGLIVTSTKANLLPSGTHIELETNQRTIKRKIQNGIHGFCWQDNGRLSIPLEFDEKPIRAKVTYRGKELANTGGLDIRQYNRIASISTAKLIERAAGYQSIIALKSGISKVAIVDLLLSAGRKDDALSELLLLLKHEESKIQRAASKLAVRLPLDNQLALAPTLLLSADTTLVNQGLELIRNTEDDRLARWLTGAIEHSEEQTACKAMDILRHFFAEEEAMILSKYAGLDSLIENAMSGNEVRQRCAVQALGESERYKAVEPLIGLLDSRSAGLRKDVIIALGRIRERDALPAMHRQLLDKNETALNRLFLVQSIKQIDSGFDEIGIMLHALQNDNRWSYLETIALAFEPSSGALQSINKTDIARRIRDWHTDTKPNLNANEKINYFKITGTQYPVPVKELLALSEYNDSQVQVNALLLLMKFDTSHAGQYLTQILSKDELSLLKTTARLELSEKSFFKVLESTLEKDRVNITNAVFPTLTEQAKQTYLLWLLAQKETESKQALLNIVFQEYTPQLNSKLCASINYLLENSNQYSESLLSLSNLLEPNIIEACYSNTKAQNQHQKLVNKLLTSSTLTPLAISFFAPRSERWARNLTQQTLTDSETSQEDKLYTISSLRPKPFPSQIKMLDRLFSNESDILLSISAAKKLAGDPDWLDDNLERIKTRIRSAISNNQEHTAIELGKIISIHYREETLELFITPSDNKPPN